MKYGGVPMRIMSHDVRLQAYSYQRTTELEHTFREVIIAEDQDEIENGEQDILDVSRENLNQGSRVMNDYTLEQELLNMSLIEIWIQALTGRQFRFKRQQSFDFLRDNANMVNFRDVRIKATTLHEYRETEEMNFFSEGMIQTDSGEKIEFSMNLKFSREYYEMHETQIEMGIPNFKDPLVINLDGKGVGFSDQKLKIDLDMDGKIDVFNGLNAGNGFLALDKNENGKVDDGSELFGPTLGNGFSELSQYDKDGNHWIDENDDIFNDLKIWQIDEEGNENLIALKDAEVGAIYLGSVGSQFDIKDGKDLIARITDSSVYLKENGLAQAIQQVDLKIEDIISTMTF